MMTNRATWRDHLAGALLALVYVMALFATADDIGMSRDESFYVHAAHQYGAWFQSAWETPSEAFSAEGVTRGWQYNNEHPALIKSLFALSWVAHSTWDIFPNESMAHRFPAMVSAGLLLWLISIFGTQLFSRRVGWIAALLFALMPRIFYHSHLNCFDIPITLMVTWVVYCYWRSLADRRWVLWLGVSFGCALATKHNSWLLPIIFGIHWVWLNRVERSMRSQGFPAEVSLFPWWLVGMCTIGPLIFVGSWPWLWHDTLPRIGNYIGFHVNHDYYNIAYLGETYFEPPFPVSYPFLMTFFTLPLLLSGLALAGLWLRMRAIVPSWAAGLVRRFPAAVPDRRRTDVLLFGCLLAPLALIALPTSPIFGGTKHWFTAYPFLVIYAGVAFETLITSLQALKVQWLPRWATAPLVTLLMLTPCLVETVHSHPFGLSYYSYAAGGVPGAADRGLNRQFWGFTTRSLTPFISERLSEGGSVFLCDTTSGAWHRLQDDGHVPRNIRGSMAIPTSDLALVHYERHFVEVDFQAWTAYQTVQPVEVLTYEGVPLITVYERASSSGGAAQQQ